MLPRVALEYGQSWCARRHQIEALLASELRCIEVERSGKTEAAALRGPDPDACRDPRVAQVELPPRRDPKQRALETGGVADGEQLLGIRPRPARAAHLTGNIERDIHTAVARPRMPLTARGRRRSPRRCRGSGVRRSYPSFRQVARLGRGFLLERGCSRARLATRYRFDVFWPRVVRQRPHRLDKPADRSELGSSEREIGVFEPHLHTFARADPARLPGHRPTAVAAIHNSTTAGSSSGRRALASMPRPLATAKVSALTCPATGGRHERSADGHMIDLIVCSICLRVRRGSEWQDAERVVREISSTTASYLGSTAPSATPAPRRSLAAARAGKTQLRRNCATGRLPASRPCGKRAV